MISRALIGTDLHADYGGIPALTEVDVEIPEAALTVIVGPNGAGKSTLLEILAGARPPASGTVDAGPRSRAFVPQRAAVADDLPLTVRDVVVVGAWGGVGLFRRVTGAHRRAVDAAMLRLDIADLARHPFSTLSGGQRQRALLAQGLARTADILLLDEPTTGLDATSAALNHAAIADEVERGVAVVCVSHDDRLISSADQVIRIEAGRLRRENEPAR
ncbi:ATP-binding cassette domain-containing protein [Microbacterium sp. P26]|uniref:zinc ABC transporter ATP-binding protein AztA n=1 Tax=Microbacterium TaxID=33882 RepID=UPI00203B3819|nr:zinc ABC transporter ATP-binding protein AztA [Microbacterium sp. P26]MCM3502618.1 ATP-binding cassette domain-containing protein [Microbacterium sp. P26]